MTEKSIPQNPSLDAWPRRTWLKAAAGAVVGWRASCALAATDKPKATRKLRMGIHSAPYAGFPLEDAVARIKADGFSSVLTDYVFADVRFDPLSPDWEAAGKITQCFERRGVRIAAVFGYYNVVDPDASRRQRGEARMAVLIANWKRLGCPVISTETGTLNPTSEWLESPENTTEKGYLVCRTAFEKMARAAEKAGAVISIEPYWRNIIDSIERTERLFREIQSPALKLVMDPCNYFRKEQLPKMRPMLEAMFKRLGSQIVVAHAKDVKAAADGTDLPAAGLGVLDYPLYLRLLAQQDRELDLLLEHLTLADVPRARDFVKGQLEKV
ncbi:MAG: sugar phosphate isomerase/epimerase family protein [Pirellulales bacterium]